MKPHLSELDLQHLFYFWHVAREGGILPAANALGLTQPTISVQLRKLENALGRPLFTREGKRLVLTDFGRFVLDYAEPIFSLRQELVSVLESGQGTGTLRVAVGVVDAIPKLLVYRLLRPVLSLERELRLICSEESSIERLLIALGNHEIDCALSDSPIPPSSRTRTAHRLIAESPVVLMGTRALVRRLKGGFPSSLHGAPLLLPRGSTSLRRNFEQWCHVQGLAPRVEGEFEDLALLLEFAAEGMGIFPVVEAIATQLSRRHGFSVLGKLGDVTEKFYLLMHERKAGHPAVARIAQGG